VGRAGSVYKCQISKGRGREDHLQMAFVLKAKPTAIPLQGREFLLCGK